MAVAGHFEFCVVENIKLYLHSKYYKDDNHNGIKLIIYDDAADFNHNIMMEVMTTRFFVDLYFSTKYRML